MNAKTEEYRTKAAECLELANRIRDPSAKRVLEEIARSWLSLSEREDRNPSVDVQPPGDITSPTGSNSADPPTPGEQLPK